MPLIPVDPTSGSKTDRAIAAAQTRVQASPGDDKARLDLAAAFLQKAREVADPSLYGKAGGLLNDLRKRHPDDGPILVASGTLALARHRFRDGMELGLKALQVAPGSEAAYGVLVDAENELGRYDDALRDTEAMADVRPDLASLSRVSYARELRGDLQGAVEAMTQAVTAGGSGGGENVAYVQVQLGTLLLTTGDVAGADAAYSAAESSFPGFAAARAGHARVLVARGRPAEAAAILAELVKVQPLAEYAVALGDDLTAAGRPKEAARAYALVDAISKLYAANGVDVDLELALFDADHRPGGASIKRARTALKDRPSQLGHDALAWNLFKAGQRPEAGAEAQRATALGWRDPAARFHAATIADANGNRQAAVDQLQMVLGTNPRFSAALVPAVTALAVKLGLSMPPPAA